MALNLLQAAEGECVRFDTDYARQNNESRLLLRMLMYLFPLIWKFFRSNLARVAQHGKEYVHEQAESLVHAQDDLLIQDHLNIYEDLYQSYQDNLASSDDTTILAYNNVNAVLPSISFLLEPTLLAYVVNTSNNFDRLEANEVVHPDLDLIREGLEFEDEGSESTNEAGVIFRAIDEPISVCSNLPASADTLIAKFILGHY